MNKGQISLSGDTAHLTPVQGAVWLSQYEIASLLGVFVSKVQANIRSVFKERLLWPEEAEEPNTQEFKISSVVPADPTQPYDVRNVIRAVVDDSDFFEVQEKFVAHQPLVMAGVILRCVRATCVPTSYLLGRVPKLR